ncbi:MAG: ATP-binding cassette subfamily F protein 3 [Verrucomicrobiales bacterium]|jgi:ATP-binding cassette subfamily F protein 3
MLTLSNVGKSYGGRVLFEKVSLQLNREERVGLVGPNGAGKSTLFSLVLGTEIPDDGSITLDKRITLGYLPQEHASAGDETVLDLATSVSTEVVELKRALILLEKEDRTHEPEYHDARMKFEGLNGLHLEPKAKRILNGLAFRQSDYDRPVREMSGGWIMRAHLARLLVMEPDLLMLDEPTNHLDLQTLQWFQNYLCSYPGGILTISHDRSFLNDIVTTIYDIDQGALHRYRGDYDAFLVQKEARFQQQLAAYQNQQREIEQLQRFIDRFRSKASKATQAQSKIKQLDKMERIPMPTKAERNLKFSFPQPKRGPQHVIALEHIQQAYGDLTVYRDLNFNVERGERVVLVGPNGAGKSTLLKILAEVVPFQNGTRKVGEQVTLGYYSQHRTEMLDLSKSVLQTVLSGRHRVGEQEARTLLGCFLFSGDDAHKSVSVLSGGEKSRLALVQFLLNPPNLLLMDEPTTHLDMASIEALITALKQYEGSLVFISHDVHFIRAISERTVHIEAGELTAYAGDYDYYREKSGATSAETKLTQSQPEMAQAPTKVNAGSGRKTKEQKRQEAIERQARAKKRKDLESQIADSEGKILKLESRRDELMKLLEDPTAFGGSRGSAIDWNRELSEIESKLPSINAKWEKQADALSELVEV